MSSHRFLDPLRLAELRLSLVAPLSLRTAEKVALPQTAPSASHFLTCRGQPIRPLGASVTPGWVESGTNFNQPFTRPMTASLR